jgi:hypothetical protein
VEPEERSVVPGEAQRAKTGSLKRITNFSEFPDASISGYAWRSRVEPEGRRVVPGEARRAKTGWLNKLTNFSYPDLYAS